MMGGGGTAKQDGRERGEGQIVDLLGRDFTHTKSSMEADAGQASPKVSSSIRGTVATGATIVFATFFGFGVWAATAPLAGAVAASATLAAEGQRRSIQHLEGGIVRHILIQEGQEVERGQVLIQLDPLAPTAQLMRLRTQLDTQRALEARLRAEREASPDIVFPPELLARAENDPEIASILVGQRQQLTERMTTLSGQIAILNQRIEQLRSQIAGRNEQHVSHIAQIAILQDELNALTPLLKRGIVAKPRLLALQRDIARLEGLLAENSANIQVAEQSIHETELQITQTSQQRLDEVITELREAEARIADLDQQTRVAADVLNRLDILAPQSGVVQNLQVSTEGGVINPGETLLEIAPISEQLLIQSRVSPNDVANVTVGQEAEVRFVSLDLRRTPEIIGHVVTLSGDRLIDEITGTPYFLAQVRTSPQEMEKLAGQRVHAGMPAEVFIQTGDRTLLQYLTKPLTDAISRGLNER